MKFLYATWEHLLLANYVVDPNVLEPFVPGGTTIDEFDGQAFVSLVAFMFDKTRLLGIPAPFHRRFEEVNLRFYVKPQKDPSVRAVTFIKEIVPRALIPLIANNLFDENYVALPMDHGVDERTYWYTWTNDHENIISGTVESPLEYPPAGSISEFITEHYWGYSQGRKRTVGYRVEHPQWKCCELNRFTVDVDFGLTYGKQFDFLNSQRPFNVLYADGSAVNVSFPSRLH